MHTISSTGAHNLYKTRNVAGIKNMAKFYKKFIPFRDRLWDKKETSSGTNYKNQKQDESFGNSFGGSFGDSFGNSFGSGF